jgi:hypothetical protein
LIARVVAGLLHAKCYDSLPPSAFDFLIVAAELRLAPGFEYPIVALGARSWGIMKVTRRVVTRDGLTAFHEINGRWYDEGGACQFYVIGTDVFRMQGGMRAFYIVDGWVFDESGNGLYYYGR